MFLGTAAWRPFDTADLSAEFEKGGGMVGGGCLEWGSHCIDQCQWANSADDTVPTEYYPIEKGRASARYGNGVKLVVRDDGWLPLGSCPVRYEGSDGWVEVGDSGQYRSVRPRCSPAEKWKWFRIILPRRTSATFSIA